ncbi:MAG: triose-phosphate isomerase [Pseudomonadota bacterium]
MRPIVAGNWKMNGLKSAIAEAKTLADHLKSHADNTHCDVMICPPATLLMVMAEVMKEHIQFGAQDCHWQQNGAHTGDVSAEMVKDAGAHAVIVGHSERREDHGETDSIVQKKAAAAHDAGLTAIICIGETSGQRDAGLTLNVVARQLEGSLPKTATAANTIIAYEPVWAIGTGKTPTTDDVAVVHESIRQRAQELMGEDGQSLRLLYGGSVKPANAEELMAVPNVNGALVGGASLKAEDFIGILAAYRAE